MNEGEFDDKGQDEFRRLGELLAHTVGRAAHDMRGPLAASRNLIRWLRKQWRQSSPERVNQRLADLELEIEVLIRLTDNIDFFRFGRQRAHSDGEAYPQSVAKEVLKNIRAQAKAEDPDIVVRVALQGIDSLPPVRVEERDLSHILYNLLSNSLRYRDRSARALRLLLEGTASDKSGSCMIYIRDWGIGIPPGWGDTIFEEGVRGPNVVRSGTTGTGIGLYVARSLAREYGGELALVKLANPTTFRLDLPISSSKHTPNQGAAPDGWRRL